MRSMRSSRLALSLAVLSLATGCASDGSRYLANPAAPGFDSAGSDPKAVAIADETMQAMGGRRAWNDARCLAWTFFGRRKHVWDKWTGDYRLEEGRRVVCMNLGTGAGRVFEGKDEIHDPKSKAEALAKARSAWINDSYWLVMPYKLKDSGVTLKSKGDGVLDDGRKADVLVLTFARVGDTPENKYDVWVAKDSRLVEQWAFYKSASDDEPRFKTTWTGWKRYGQILLSGDRGGDRQLTDIAVMEKPPPQLYAAP